MIYIFPLIIFYLVFSKLQRLLSAIDFMERKIAQKYFVQSKNDIRFTILVPLLNNLEQIHGFMSCFNRLDGRENAKIIFVVSGKSNNLNQIPEIIKSNINPEQIIVVPKEHSHNKAAQLNYSLKLLNIHDSNHYFVIFDADSRPDTNTFNAAISVISQNKNPLVLQQPSLYGASGTVLQQMEGIFQDLWTFQYEIYYFIRNFHRPTNITYLIGHGLFIRSDFLMKNNFPNKTVEDLCYGYQLSFNGVYPYLIPAFDHSETPSTFSQYLSQKRRWYQGSIYAIFSVVGFKSLPLIFRWFRRLLWDIEWGMVNVLVILFSLYFFSIRWAVFIVFIWILTYYFLPVFIFYKKARLMRIINIELSSSKILTLSFLYFFLYNLGPIIGLISYKPSKI